MNMLARTILILGLAGYLLIQTGLVIYTDVVRPVPVEVDDAYSYIVKAVRAEHGFGTRLQGIETLREQVVRDSVDKKVEVDRYRIYWFVHYI